MKVCIDPGHGGRTTGAVGSKRIPEKDIVLKVAKELGRHLIRHNVDVIYTRTTDVYVSLPDRCNIANKGKVDYFISVHINGYHDPSANGTECCCYGKGKPGESLAIKILDEMIKFNNLKRRGVRYRPDLYVLNSTIMPAVLPELAFLTNPDEEKLLLDPEWQNGMAAAIAKGFLKEVGILWQDESQVPASKHSIMGAAEVTAAQMAAFVKAINPNFNPDIAETFLRVGTKYGIRGDVAFCQSIKETGWFRFKGDVKESQNNFAGIGATGGVPGNSFATIDDGVTAQIQHLYAYATTLPIPAGEVIIDPRFQYVTRGTAPNWEDLNGRWAVPGLNYGQEILQIFEKLKQVKVPEIDDKDQRIQELEISINLLRGQLETVSKQRDELQLKINKVLEVLK